MSGAKRVSEVSRRGASRPLALAALALALSGAPALAQRGAQLDIQLAQQGTASSAPAGVEGPRIAVSHVFADPEMRELLRSSFPAQLRFRMELWREGGWFDDLERAVEWDVVVAYDPTAELYRVRRRMGSQVEDLGGHSTLTSAQAVLERPYRVALAPTRSGRRYYYSLSLDVETLSVSDLDQLERWLRGELRPAVSGQANPANALGNGVRTLVSRVLGGERRHYERRSETFRAR
jgi:hypothetical protein